MDRGIRKNLWEVFCKWKLVDCFKAEFQLPTFIFPVAKPTLSMVWKPSIPITFAVLSNLVEKFKSIWTPWIVSLRPWTLTLKFCLCSLARSGSTSAPDPGSRRPLSPSYSCTFPNNSLYKHFYFFPFYYLYLSLLLFFRSLSTFSFPLFYAKDKGFPRENPAVWGPTYEHFVFAVAVLF